MLVLLNAVRTLLCLQGATDKIWEPFRTTRRYHSDTQLQDELEHFHYIEQS
jgi:hypothetical protein